MSNRGKSCSRHSRNNRMWWTGFHPVILKKLVSLSFFHCKPLCKSLWFWCSMGQLFIDILNAVRSFYDDFQETTGITFCLFRFPFNVYMFIWVINTQPWKLLWDHYCYRNTDPRKSVASSNTSNNGSFTEMLTAEHVLGLCPLACSVLS